MSMHKATSCMRDDRCKWCLQEVHLVPGGQGPVWVHEDGHVVATTDADRLVETLNWTLRSLPGADSEIIDYVLDKAGYTEATA